jgi:hypothetical protein
MNTNTQSQKRCHAEFDGVFLQYCQERQGGYRTVACLDAVEAISV